MDWSDVWSGRTKALGLSWKKSFTLRNLIALNGFDSGAGAVDTGFWMRNALQIRSHLGIRRGDSLLEVGCGSGALMRALGGGIRFTGLDFSPSLLRVAKRAVPTGNFHLWDLNKNGGKLPPPAHTQGEVQSYDFVVVHGVLHYLGLASAREVVRESLRVAAQKVFIGEIPSLERQVQASAVRNRSLPPGEYDQKYADLAHTFFAADFFHQIIAEDEFSGVWQLSLFPTSLLESRQAAFRYAILLTKIGASRR